MLAEGFAQHLVEKVGTAVVAGDACPSGCVHHELELTCAAGRHLLGNVDGEAVLLEGVDDVDLLAVGGNDEAGVADLATHLAVERSAVEDELEHLPVLLDYSAAPEQFCAADGGVVVAYEFALALEIFGPVAELVGCGVAGAVLLLLEVLVEAVQIDLEAVLGGDELRQVDREAIGVIELEGVLAADELAVCCPFHTLVHQLDAAVEGAQEGHFFLADDVFDELLLLGELRVGLAHIGYELWHELAQERFVQAEEGVAVADCAAQNPSDDVAGLDVGRELAVGDGEADGADVVRDYPHRNVGVVRLAVAVAAELTYFGEHCGEYV